MAEALDQAVRSMLQSSDLSDRQVTDVVRAAVLLDTAGARPTRVIVPGLPAEGAIIEALAPVDGGGDLIAQLVVDKGFVLDELAGVGLPVNDMLHLRVGVR